MPVSSDAAPSLRFNKDSRGVPVSVEVPEGVDPMEVHVTMTNKKKVYDVGRVVDGVVLVVYPLGAWKGVEVAVEGGEAVKCDVGGFLEVGVEAAVAVDRVGQGEGFEVEMYLVDMVSGERVVRQAPTPPSLWLKDCRTGQELYLATCSPENWLGHCGTATCRTLRPATYTLYATCSYLTPTANTTTITIEPSSAQPATLTLEPPPSTAVPGTLLTLSATLHDADGNPVAEHPPIPASLLCKTGPVEAVLDDAVVVDGVCVFIGFTLPPGVHRLSLGVFNVNRVPRVRWCAHRRPGEGACHPCLPHRGAEDC
eukprot:TRINITY_DN3621_c0_g1_i3.p1 TRINITY_DN3621_c0_g1~~TRINITY_DN3621_c0_g1_i3.p1  ORF type:complete len:333 (+),score=28.22 TRINITY_DN3621_c0_g1_i3:67-999(+)